MYHAKIIVIDESWTSIGSANFDERSFRLNDEANLNVYSHEFATEQIAIFEQDLARSSQVAPKDWAGRPLLQKITDWIASTLRVQL
ncbi:phospholipase D-like domain-containing protein [Devosia sp. J2-20]|uniref:phospholipase D-like domain-containing protein n=1 Tax=Devosia sp. J2-20 TaxID=3026161 RepID=UPI002499C507|nr:phospholipase D-like domain-containing protein [Devosia sp. J2-20]WDQ98833.1 phospholipase D-like domain-containing protein [Devosia sp. J2-20]